MSTSTPQPVITASDNDRANAASFIAKPDDARNIIEQACFLALRRKATIQRRDNLEQAKKIVYVICGEALAQEIATSPGVQEIHTYLGHLDELIDTHYELGRATGVFRRVAKAPDTNPSQRASMFNQLLNNYAAAVFSTMPANTTGFVTPDSALHQLNETFFDTWWDSLDVPDPTNPDVTTRFNPDPTLIDDQVTARYDSELSHLRNTLAHKSPHALHNAMTHVLQRLDYQLGLTDEAARHAQPATDNQEALALTHLVLSNQVPIVLRDAAVAVLCDHPVSARALLHRVAVTCADSETRAMALTLYALIGHHNQVAYDFTEALDAARSAQPEHAFTSLIARAHADNELDQVYEKAMTESVGLRGSILTQSSRP